MAAFIRDRRRSSGSRPIREGPTSDRLVPIVITALSLVGLGALSAGATLAVGDTRGHAFGHLAVGLVCFALFLLLALRWHPAGGSRAGTFRGLSLLLLAVGAFGSFVESLGASGYDAANSTRRISALGALHDVGLLFAPPPSSRYPSLS
jgi:hypothetical protein